MPLRGKSHMDLSTQNEPFFTTVYPHLLLVSHQHFISQRLHFFLFRRNDYRRLQNPFTGYKSQLFPKKKKTLHEKKVNKRSEKDGNDKFLKNKNFLPDLIQQRHCVKAIFLIRRYKRYKFSS